jgi:hypothetical protein
VATRKERTKRSAAIKTQAIRKFHHHHHHHPLTTPIHPPTKPPIPRTTTPADPATTQTATATTSAVTSGSTGIAAFSCNSTATTHSSTSNTPYVQECYTQYQTNHPSFYSVDGNVTMRNLGGKITVYSFPACLDKCDAYNRERNVPACRAVTYYANLSWPIQQWGGNCFLKNDRGFGYQTDPVDYSHTASAYQECLNSTCWADG